MIQLTNRPLQYVWLSFECTNSNNSFNILGNEQSIWLCTWLCVFLIVFLLCCLQVLIVFVFQYVLVLAISRLLPWIIVNFCYLYFILLYVHLVANTRSAAMKFYWLICMQCNKVSRECMEYGEPIICLAQ